MTTDWQPGKTPAVPAADALRAQGRTPSGGFVPSPEQIAYVRSLQKQLRLPNRLLDAHCQATYGAPFADLDKRAVSRLLDELIAWKAIPADLQREQGQQDLPGFGGDR